MYTHLLSLDSILDQILSIYLEKKNVQVIFSAVYSYIRVSYEEASLMAFFPLDG
jgi:hypothetical protein